MVVEGVRFGIGRFSRLLKFRSPFVQVSFLCGNPNFSSSERLSYRMANLLDFKSGKGNNSGSWISGRVMLEIARVLPMETAQLRLQSFRVNTMHGRLTRRSLRPCDFLGEH